MAKYSRLDYDLHISFPPVSLSSKEFPISHEYFDHDLGDINI